MKKITMLLCMLSLSSLSLAYIQAYSCPYSNVSKPDYYWRLYTGVVPFDAIQGGYAKDGSITYIGQVLYPNTEAIIPAILTPPSKAGLSTALAITFKYEIYVTILCSQQAHRLRWQFTTIEELSQVAGTLVRGGTEINKIVYVGRGMVDNKLKVGKVFEYKEPNRGLWIPKDNGTPANLLEFEILTFL